MVSAHVYFIWPSREKNILGEKKIINITVIKTLLISKVTYYFINPPDPPPDFLKSLDEELFCFFWGRKQNRIKKSVVRKPYSEGGLKMCDLFSFISTMKISWLKRIDQDNSTTRILLVIYPIFKNIKKLGGWVYQSYYAKRSQLYLGRCG